MPTTTDNIKIEFNDGVGSSNYQFEYNPKMIEINYEEIKDAHQMANGLTKYYIQGYKCWMTLTWNEPVFFRNDQYDKFRVIKNRQVELTIVPNPVSAPQACYTMNWINDFEFNFVRGVSAFGFGGQMVLEGTCLLSSIDDKYMVLLGSG